MIPAMLLGPGKMRVLLLHDDRSQAYARLYSLGKIQTLENLNHGKWKNNFSKNMWLPIQISAPVAFANCIELSAIAMAISAAKAAQAMVARP